MNAADDKNMELLERITSGDEKAFYTFYEEYKPQLRSFAVAGIKNIEKTVTNLWVNRLIGDEQSGVASRITYTTQSYNYAQSPLLPSGLLGPVKLIQQNR